MIPNQESDLKKRSNKLISTVFMTFALCDAMVIPWCAMLYKNADLHNVLLCTCMCLYLCIIEIYIFVIWWLLSHSWSLPSPQLCAPTFKNRKFIRSTMQMRWKYVTCISGSNMKLRWSLQIWMRQVRTKLWTIDDDDDSPWEHTHDTPYAKPTERKKSGNKIPENMICYDTMRYVYNTHFSDIIWCEFQKLSYPIRTTE